MKISALLVAGCLCSGVIVPAVAQTTAATAQTPGASAASSAGSQGPENTQLAALASQDFGRLSVDGNTAFEDVGLARHAIFDGDLKTAGLFITSARDALERAGQDNTAFQKAEDELMPNKVRQQPPRPVPSGGKQVVWLPIDGELVLDETIEPTSEKTAALAAANRHLKAGNTARASEVLKISGVDADYIIAAVPLEQAQQDVARAAKILKNDPYKASEALRVVENSVRYASVDIQAVSHPLSDGASAGKSDGK